MWAAGAEVRSVVITTEPEAYFVLPNMVLFISPNEYFIYNFRYQYAVLRRNVCKSYTIKIKNYIIYKE